MISNRLAVLGAGGHGKVVADTAQAACQWEEIVFFDDSFPERRTHSEWPIAGTIKHFLSEINQFDSAIVAIGDNRKRLILTQNLLGLGANIVSIVHPSANVSPSALVQRGSVICAGAVVNIDASVGLACIVNTSAVVEHDCMLKDGVHVSPQAGVAGAVEVGSCSWIGIGTAVRQCIKIGSNVVVGAGSVVIDNVPNDVTVVGNPARKK